MINPIQLPRKNIPTLGKYPAIYPIKKLQIPVMIRVFVRIKSGTPGKKMILA